MNFKNFYESNTNKILISVDIQPEYYHKNSKFGGFYDNLLTGFINALNSAEYDTKIVLFNGYDTLGMITLDEYKIWLIENGLDEEVINEIKFYDKGYAFFRFCLDSGIDEDDIVLLVKFMYMNDITDSRDIKDSNLWDKFVQEYNKVELRELLEDASDNINIPDLMDWLKKNIPNGSDITLIGGGRNECLKETEIAMKALNIPYHTDDNLIYETNRG